MAFNISLVMTCLAKSRPLFHSEADFQHAFAWEMQKQLPNSSIRLEKPIQTFNGFVHLDVLVQNQNKAIAIELKYKTKLFSIDTPTESFNLRNHSARDIGCYDFIKDIRRVENICMSNPNTNGYAILLTNDGAYWRSPTSNTTVDAAFRLHEGRLLSGEVAWGVGASSGTMKSRENPILLSSSYSMKWHDYSYLTNSGSPTFRYLMVAVK